MIQKFGTKNGKKEKKIRKKNLQRKKKKIAFLEEEQEKKELEKEKQKEQERQIISYHLKKEKVITEEKEKSSRKKNISVKKEKKEIPLKEIEITSTPIEEKEGKRKERKGITSHQVGSSKKEKLPEERKKDSSSNLEDYLIQEITRILEKNIQDHLYQLKKLDSDIDTIERNIDNTIEDKDLKQIEKEIQNLIEQLNQIKKQILSLEKTFDLKFPVAEPDHYLIYLIEELKNQRKNEKELSKNLTDNNIYQSIIDKMMEIELKKDELVEKIKEKERELLLEEEQINKMNEEVINTEESITKITEFVKKQEEILKEIERKVDETVQITERVEYITKSVAHSLLELFLLMHIFKRNISIKNNAIAAIEAAVAFELIQKMCTPVQEKVIIQESNLKDYKQMITTYIKDTSKLSNILNQNLNSISSIRYTFEKDYQNCSHLPAYKQVMNHLQSLEEEMKTRKDEVNRMQKEIEYQLEKNNAKVKKYSH